jgi:prevent-host-death family protein
MAKQVRATDAKNNFGGLLEDVATLGRVDVVRHGRVVAVILAPREHEDLVRAAKPRREHQPTHMIPTRLARRARVVRQPNDFDDDWQ